jgi:hypothetical protein
MEYDDFLTHWEGIERTQIFDNSWVQSSHWLNVKSRPMPSAWQFGDVSCVSVSFLGIFIRLNLAVTFNTPKRTDTVLVLSQSDTRYYQSVQSAALWSFDFKLFKMGSDEVLGSSSHSYGVTRSVTLTIELPPGDYVVHVRAYVFSPFRHQLMFDPLGAIEQKAQCRSSEKFIHQPYKPHSYLLNSTRLTKSAISWQPGTSRRCLTYGAKSRGASLWPAT